jgi:hypothetical protein
MPVDRDVAAKFAADYGRTWEDWDREAWVDLFAEDIVYVVHPSVETVVGRKSLGPYFDKEAAEQGDVKVDIGRPVIDADHVAAEFWVTSKHEEATLTGCFIARLDSDGRCNLFREYFFNLEKRVPPYEEWGR